MLTRWASSILASLAVLSAGVTPVRADGDSAGAMQLKGCFQTILREEGDRGVGLNQDSTSEGPFNLVQLAVKAEAALSDRVSVFTRLNFDSGASFDVSVYGAYVMFSRFLPADLHVELGKVPSPFGTFAERSYPDKNPLIGTPLMYHYHTSMRPDRVPFSADDLLSARGQGQFGFSYLSGDTTGMQTRRGVPVLYDSWWDFGMVCLGTWGNFEGRLGLMNGAPGIPEARAEVNDSRAPIGRIGWVPSPWLRAGASAGRGAYLSQGSEPYLPAGKGLRDYQQSIVGLDLELTHGWWDFHAEWAGNTFESPYITEDLTGTAWYVEARRKLAAGTYAAARWDDMRFGEIRDSSGASQTWDQNVQRFEAGVGYWPERKVLLKADVQMHRMDSGSWDRDNMIGGLQATLWF